MASSESSRSSVSRDPDAAARIERLENDLQALKRKQSTVANRNAAGAGGGGGAGGGADAAKPKRVKQAPPLTLALTSRQRCQQWDKDGACDLGDECPAYKRNPKSHSCAMCLGTDHHLSGPNGRCTNPAPQ